MKKKALVSLTVLMLVLAMALTGCGGNSNSTEPQDQDKNEIKYPERPITMIIPNSPGGSTDLLGRTVAKGLEKYLGQPVIVQNKPGGSTTIGANELMNSKPDGYTIGSVNTGMITSSVLKKSPTDYAQELEPIALAAISPQILAVKSDSEWKTLDEFINYAKTNPGKIKIGHTSVGGSTHMATALFEKTTGIEIEDVTFDGGSNAVAALLGGHIQAAMLSPVDFKQFMESKQVTALAETGEERIDDPVYKDVPTFKELGYDFSEILWQGFGAPKNMPEEVKHKLVEAFKKTINDPEIKQAIIDLGLTPKYSTPEEFKKMWLETQEKYKDVFTEIGLIK
ncbi:tripartite tricarboxylate transporter substrate binding protein [Thermoanaerobacterium sp. DL9XJH110]|uniref:tripartite tricarboxylate transporter substrate binding protein n=1 Tax=Thermoanaerobacterium sp. DL9XJH110 TaxID=3386643 RepID=UPI003BB7169D